MRLEAESASCLHSIYGYRRTHPSYSLDRVSRCFVWESLTSRDKSTPAPSPNAHPKNLLRQVQSLQTTFLMLRCRFLSIAYKHIFQPVAKYTHSSTTKDKVQPSRIFSPAACKHLFPVGIRLARMRDYTRVQYDRSNKRILKLNAINC